MFDVAVIGAGPAGSMCSRLLAQRGHSVVLFEGHDRPGEHVNCSGIIGTEAFRHFDLPERTSIRNIQSFRFHSPAGKLLEYCHDRPLAVAVDRANFDRELAADAISSGAELKTGTRINSVHLFENHVELLTQSGEIVQSRFVVVATGAGSPLPKQLNLGPSGKFVVGAQTICESDMEDVEIYLGSNHAPSNFAWAIPLQKGFAKIGLICHRNGVSSLHRFLEILRSSGRIRRHHRVQCSILPLSPLKKSFTHRAIVIGEAAGQMKTITCGGIYYGLLAAEIGSEVLHHAILEKRGDSEFLSEYETRWKNLLGKELKIGLRFRTLFERLSDSRIDALFEIAAKDGIMRLIREKADFDWHSDLVSNILRHTLVRGILNPVAYGRLLLFS